MTAALVGFAIAGLLPEGEPYRTLRRAMWLEVAACVVAAASPSLWVLLAARLGQGLGVGMMVAGGLADVPRRLSARDAGRVTGLLISGTAAGGLVGRAFGYVGLALGWRAAFAAGGLGVLVVCGLSLAGLARRAEGGPARPAPAGGRAPLSITLAGLFILFVSVGYFDLLPYRVTSPAIALPPAVGDLIYLVFAPAIFAGMLAGRAVDRYGARPVIITTALGAGVLMLVGLAANPVALAVGGLGAICGTVALHVAHSGWAAAHGRRAVGRYLAAYYIGGAVSAPVCAFGYGRFGWPGAVGPLVGVTAVVLVLALLRPAVAATPSGQARPPAISAP